MYHHVYFWLHPEHQTDADRTAFEQGLKALTAIPGNSGAIIARPAKTPERPVMDQSWDYALMIPFDSVDAHNTYQNHPDHEQFVEKFSHLWAKVDVRDLEAI